MFESVLEIPPCADHTSTVIFLPGSGDTGENWVNRLKPKMPKNTKLVLPTAKEMYVTTFEKRMPSWFDSLSLDKRNGPEDLQGIIKAHSQINILIEKESSKVPRNHIVLGGFSMGGALALYTGLNGRDLAGTFCMGGYIPHRKNVNYSADFPILLMHGESDYIIPFEYAELACEILRENDVEFQFQSYPKTGHTGSKEMLEEVEKFLRKCL